MNEEEFIKYALKITDLSKEKQLLAFNKIANFASDNISKKRDFSGLKTISFKTKFPIFSNFWQTLLKRRTDRNFTNENINLKQLKLIVSSGFLQTDNFFITPSAGGMQSISGYVVNYNIKDLQNGIYYIEQNQQNLVYINDKTIDKNIFFTEGDILQQTDFALILTTNFAELGPKYSTRALRLGILDSGHLMQNILLSCAQLKLKVIPLGGFNEEQIINDLNLINEYPIYTAIFSK